MALLTLTLNNPAANTSGLQHQETQYIARCLQLAERDIRSSGGKKTSGNIIDGGTAVLGTWTYTPVSVS
jgi:hypothetical protein